MGVAAARVTSNMRCVACLQAAFTASPTGAPTPLPGERFTYTMAAGSIQPGQTITYSASGTMSWPGGAGGSTTMSFSGGGGGYSSGGSPTGRQWSAATQNLKNLAMAMGAKNYMRDLPVVKRTEPYRAYKGSILEVQGHPYGVSVGFAGVSGGARFGTEGYAECSYHQRGEIPVQGCHCGFWAVKDPTDIFTGTNAWMLEVDLHGRVIRGSRGYRAQWQRVISITPPAWCDGCDDMSPATCLVRSNGTILAVSCAGCAMENESMPIPKPLSWLRSKLGVEVKAEFLTDEPPPMMPATYEDATDVRKELQRGIDAYVGSMNETLMRRLLKVHADMVKTPGLVPGRTWRKMIRTSATERPLVLEMCVANGGLAMQLARTGPDGTTAAEVLWQEQLPL